MHFAMSAVLGYSAGGSGAAAIAGMLRWMAIVFVSVLVHELGHALASMAFGYRPSVQLVALGGNTQPNAPGPIPWGKDFALTLAGPMFGLILAAVALGVRQVVADPSFRQILVTVTGVNVFWTIANLLPIVPMDGGRLARLVLVRIFGRPGGLAANVLSLLVAAVAIIWSVRSGMMITAILFGMFAVRAVTEIAAYMRGEDAPVAAGHPSGTLLLQARAAYETGKLDEARRDAQAVLETDAPPQAAANAHHLLGWIALKEGQGREALDHFSQMNRQPVENHALAAAFSLIGDDLRALALWELAFRETGDRTVLHEWAGALIRQGRTEDARRLPGVDMAAAFACAQRVLFIRQELAAAARVGEDAMREKPSAQTAYDTACAFARLGKVDEALRHLEQANTLGFTDGDYASKDPDLERVRSDPRFIAWLARLKESPRR